MNDPSETRNDRDLVSLLPRHVGRCDEVAAMENIKCLDIVEMIRDRFSPCRNPPEWVRAPYQKTTFPGNPTTGRGASQRARVLGTSGRVI
jgi:hypothetical protein